MLMFYLTLHSYAKNMCQKIRMDTRREGMLTIQQPVKQGSKKKCQQYFHRKF